MLSDTYIQNLGQIATLAGLSGGFMIAVVFQLLSMPERKRGTFLTILMALVSSGSSVLCCFLCTFSIIGCNNLLQAGQTEIPEPYEMAFSYAIIGFFIGIFTFLATLGLAGWLHSKLLGLMSLCLAVLIAVVMFNGFAMMISYNITPAP